MARKSSENGSVSSDGAAPFGAACSVVCMILSPARVAWLLPIVLVFLVVGPWYLKRDIFQSNFSYNNYPVFK
jgi:hypothetical protein